MGKKKVEHIVVGDDDFTKSFKNWTKDLGVVPKPPLNCAIVGSTPVPKGYNPNKVYKAVKNGGINKVKSGSNKGTGNPRGRPPKIKEDNKEEEEFNDDDNEQIFEIEDNFF